MHEERKGSRNGILSSALAGGALSRTTEWEVCESLNHDDDDEAFGVYVCMCTCEIGDEKPTEERSDPTLA
ncbi:hypothetical protein Trydic_g851 [Trypoxylus dichotomus]